MKPNQIVPTLMRISRLNCNDNHGANIPPGLQWMFGRIKTCNNSIGGYLEPVINYLKEKVDSIILFGAYASHQYGDAKRFTKMKMCVYINDRDSFAIEECADDLKSVVRFHGMKVKLIPNVFSLSDVKKDSVSVNIISMSSTFDSGWIRPALVLYFMFGDDNDGRARSSWEMTHLNRLNSALICDEDRYFGLLTFFEVYEKRVLWLDLTTRPLDVHTIDSKIKRVEYYAERLTREAVTGTEMRGEQYKQFYSELNEYVFVEDLIDLMLRSENLWHPPFLSIRLHIFTRARHFLRAALRRKADPQKANNSYDLPILTYWLANSK